MIFNTVLPSGGDSGSVIITDVLDEHGGIIREITSADEVYLQNDKSVTPTESPQTIIPDSNYDGLSQVSVGAISSTYVGSGIARKSSTDLTVSGATVTAPAGYYSASASKSVATATQATPSVSINSSTGLVTATATQSEGYVASGSKSGTLQLTTQAAATITPSTSSQTAVAAGRYTTGAVTVAAMPSGTAGTPTASKGTVSNNSVTVTPSVTNTTGYITGGTKTGTGVSVSASELVSGTYSVTSSGTKDVTNYASISVSAGTAGTPTATKGTVSNNSVTVTPSVTNTAGYIISGTKTGTGVTVSASELVSGTYNAVQNGTVDITNYQYVNVNVPAPSAQAKTATSSASQQTISPDTGYSYLTQVTILPMPYTQTLNSAGGYTVTIG